MRAVVLHEPTLSRNAAVAAVVEEALVAGGWQARTADVCRAHSVELAGCDLLLVGAPTHSFPAPRPRAPLSERRQPPPEHVLTAREWLALLDEAFPRTASRPVAAVFESRRPDAGAPTTSAARQAARVLAAQGFGMAGAPATFFLEPGEDPGHLVVPDPERARVAAWTRAVAVRAAALRGPSLADD